MTYEQLMELEERNGKVAKGFQPEQIDQIPRKRVDIVDNENPASCAVCFENFEVGDCTMILQCKHDYHESCIDKWLQSEKRCPVCNLQIDIAALCDQDDYPM